MPEVRERGRTNYVWKKFKRHTKVQVQEMRKGLHNGKPQPASRKDVRNEQGKRAELDKKTGRSVDKSGDEAGVFTEVTKRLTR